MAPCSPAQANAAPRPSGDDRPDAANAAQLLTDPSPCVDDPEASAFPAPDRSQAVGLAGAEAGRPSARSTRSNAGLRRLLEPWRSTTRSAPGESPPRPLPCCASTSWPPRDPALQCSAPRLSLRTSGSGETTPPSPAVGEWGDDTPVPDPVGSSGVWVECPGKLVRPSFEGPRVARGVLAPEDRAEWSIVAGADANGEPGVEGWRGWWTRTGVARA